MENFQELFFERLIAQYGEWKKESHLFGRHTYGELSELLCISASQFSKLISGTATDGMYSRSLRNLEQLAELDKLRAFNEEMTVAIQQSETANAGSTIGNLPKRYLLSLLLASLLACLLGYWLNGFSAGGEDQQPLSTKHALSQFFDQDFRSPHSSPFLSTMEAIDYCPCSAYEGNWELDKEYIIPVPAKKPGLYYLAKSSDLRMKCFLSEAAKQPGFNMIGFEQMTHELWIDTENEPLHPRFFNLSTKDFTKDFYALDFEASPRFKRIATISSFMYNRFKLEDGQIYRWAEPIGRYASEVDNNLADKHEVDVKDILGNVIGNLIKTNCQPAQNEYCNPNMLLEGESSIRFNCDYTINTENLGIGGAYPYTKGFRLVKQNYSDNLLCRCDD